jgi:hypothetical protein
MRTNAYARTEPKLMSLRQFFESLKEDNVFAIEIQESEKDEITIKLLFED